VRSFSGEAAALKPKSAFHQAWRMIDDHYIKPRVGGKMRTYRYDGGSVSDDAD
jgi:hypothetical protein